MQSVHPTTLAAITYLIVGAAVVLIHPLLIRDLLPDLRGLDLGVAGFLLKPLIALLVFLLFCTLWPVAWFNTARSERRRQAAVAAQLERLKPFGKLYAAMNAPVRYAGGDGSSLDHAVIILGANVVSGPAPSTIILKGDIPDTNFSGNLSKTTTDGKMVVLKLRLQT